MWMITIITIIFFIIIVFIKDLLFTQYPERHQEKIDAKSTL